jgi:hypothetical protein
MMMPEMCEYLIKNGHIANAEEFETRLIQKIMEVMRLIFITTMDKLHRKHGTFELFGYDFMLD